MITGSTAPYSRNAALDMGAFGYIIKPFEANEVLINVANALRRRKLEIENPCTGKISKRSSGPERSPCSKPPNGWNEVKRNLSLARERRSNGWQLPQNIATAPPHSISNG